VLTAASVAVSNYSLFLLASDISTRRLASLLALFLAAGTLASMLTAEDPEWWQSNFSALGMGSAFSSRAFNLTVIIAGLVVTTLADYITTDLRARRWPKGQVTHGVGVVRTILIVVGIAFIGVGAVPVNDSQLVHNIFSILLIAGFTALIAVTPALLRELPWAFTAASTVFLGAIVVIVLLWVPFGYYNLTAVELLGVTIVFAWLVLFSRNVAAGRDAARTSSSPRPESNPPAHPVAGRGTQTAAPDGSRSGSVAHRERLPITGIALAVATAIILAAARSRRRSAS
jgi:hypothetical protein